MQEHIEYIRLITELARTFGSPARTAKSLCIFGIFYDEERGLLSIRAIGDMRC